MLCGKRSKPLSMLSAVARQNPKRTGWATLRRKYNPDRSFNVDQDNLWVRPSSRFPRRGLPRTRHRFPYFTKQLEWRHSTRFSRKLALFCRSLERSRGRSAGGQHLRRTEYSARC